MASNQGRNPAEGRIRTVTYIYRAWAATSRREGPERARRRRAPAAALGRREAHQ
jgi:hypothetical protein